MIPSASDEHAQCDWKECSEPSTNRCGGCGVARYCSKECQLKDWKCAVNPHKAMCKILKKREDTSGGASSVPKWGKMVVRFKVRENPQFWGLFVVEDCERNAKVKVTKSSSDFAVVTIGKSSDIVLSKEDALTELSLFFSAIVIRTHGDLTVTLEVDDVLVEVQPNPDAVEVYLRNRWGLKQLW